MSELTLWTDAQITKELLARAEPWEISIEAAMEVIHLMQADYAAQYAALAAENEALKSELATQTDTIDIQAQTIELLNAHIARLEKQLEEAQPPPALPIGEPADVTVTIASTPAMTSQMIPGVSFIRSPTIFNQAGWNNAKVALGNNLGAFNLHLMNFGMTDPWQLSDPEAWEAGTVTVPDPATPNRLSGATNRVVGSFAKMQEIRATNPDAEFIFTLYNIPWWMKGVLNNDGTTRCPLAYPSEVYEDYGRPMHAYLPYLRLLIKEAAKLTMAAPYNTRWFQVWNEFKGLYNNRKRVGQQYEYDFLAGDTSGAQMGYGYLYIECVRALWEAADELGIERSAIRVGGPYTNMRTNGKLSNETVPNLPRYALLYDRPYGTWKKAAIQAFAGFLDGIEGGVLAAVDEGRLPQGTTVRDILHFVTCDFGPRNTDNVYLTLDQWAMVTKYSDLFTWIQGELAAHGLSDLPIVGSEVYKGLAGIAMETADPKLILAVATETYRRLLLGGIRYALAWGPAYEADDTSNLAAWMITNPATTDGGLPLQWGVINGWFRDHFGPGTDIYEVTSDDGSVTGIASDKKVLVIHHLNEDRSAAVGGELVPLAGLDVQLLDR